MSARFASYVGEPTESGCKEWTGALGRGGYGKFRPSPSQSSTGAHRVAYEIAHGPIPPGMFVCHSCDNRKCVAAEHLWLGSALENNRDMVLKGRNAWDSRTHCKNGHEYTPENTTFFPSKPNARCCKTCRYETNRRARGDVGCKHRRRAA